MRVGGSTGEPVAKPATGPVLFFKKGCAMLDMSAIRARAFKLTAIILSLSITLSILLTALIPASAGDSRFQGSRPTDQEPVPAGLSAADWSQIRALLPSAALPSQQAYLKASNTEAADQFGRSAAVYGDNLVVGAPEEDSNAIGVNGNQADNTAETILERVREQVQNIE